MVDGPARVHRWRGDISREIHENVEVSTPFLYTPSIINKTPFAVFFVFESRHTASCREREEQDAARVFQVHESFVHSRSSSVIRKGTVDCAVACCAAVARLKHDNFPEISNHPHNRLSLYSWNLHEHDDGIQSAHRRTASAAVQKQRRV